MFTEALLRKNLVVKNGFAGFIKTATTSGRRQIVDVITLAFATDPAARWAYPNSQQYLEYFPNFVRLFGGKAFETESAHYAESFSAAALWLPPGVSADEEALAALFQNTVSKSRQDDLFTIFERMGKFRPDEPHWYLPLIGVDPMRQGKGLGSMLLQHALAVCDREQLPAYLESTNPRNVSLYQRHGFEVTGTIQVGQSPPIFPMVRRPQRIGSNLSAANDRHQIEMEK